MNPASVETALSVKSDSFNTHRAKPNKEVFRWLEDNTVLLYRPSGDFSAGVTYTLAVGSEARTAHGQALDEPIAYTFTMPELDMGRLVELAQDSSFVKTGEYALKGSGHKLNWNYASLAHQGGITALTVPAENTPIFITIGIQNGEVITASLRRHYTETEGFPLCHTPRGNPNNAHTIYVGYPAVSAHMAHGDTFGPCLKDGNADIARVNLDVLIGTKGYLAPNGDVVTTSQGVVSGVETLEQLTTFVPYEKGTIIETPLPQDFTLKVQTITECEAYTTCSPDSSSGSGTNTPPNTNPPPTTDPPPTTTPEQPGNVTNPSGSSEGDEGNTCNQSVVNGYKSTISNLKSELSPLRRELNQKQSALQSLKGDINRVEALQEQAERDRETASRELATAENTLTTRESERDEALKRLLDHQKDNYKVTAIGAVECGGGIAAGAVTGSFAGPVGTAVGATVGGVLGCGLWAVNEVFHDVEESSKDQEYKRAERAVKEAEKEKQEKQKAYNEAVRVEKEYEQKLADLRKEATKLEGEISSLENTIRGIEKSIEDLKDDLDDYKDENCS